MNVTLLGAVLLLIHIGLKTEDILTLFFSLLTYGIAISVLKTRIQEENELYLLAVFPIFPVFAICLNFFNPSIEVIFGFASVFALLTPGYLIRVYWNISAHVTTAMGILMILLLVDPVFLPFGVITPIVVWSRLKTESHTLHQVLAGLLLGFVTPILMYLLLEAVLGPFSYL